MYRILIEAAGALTSAFLIKAIQQSGNACIATDIVEQCHAKYIADEFHVVPKKDAPDLWGFFERFLSDKQVDIVIPSLDETLLEWSNRRTDFQRHFGIEVIVSEPGTVKLCLDKWLLYTFCLENDILVPDTSLSLDFEVLKPRFGRGSKGVFFRSQLAQGVIEQLTGYISQEFIDGEEYTVDCLFDAEGDPVYIVPRVRVRVVDGKSVVSQIKLDAQIVSIVNRIAKKLQFRGLVNFQFKKWKDRYYLIEINPRLASGMALSFEATENWIPLLVGIFKEHRKVEAKPIQDGLMMYRYYSEIFAQGDT